MDVKEAITYLKGYTKWNIAQGFPAGKNDEAISVVLSELEKKDKDIQRMQELLDISDANNVKKDKIIDLMAEFMAGGNSYMYGTAEDIKEDFTKKVEGE